MEKKKKEGENAETETQCSRREPKHTHSDRLDWAESYVCVCYFTFGFFFATTFDFFMVNSVFVYCLQILQITFLSNFFIKNESYSIIYTFKNYFTTVFLVFNFSKISSIQTDPIYRKAISKKIYSKASVIHALRKTNTKFRVTEKRREKWR